MSTPSRTSSPSSHTSARPPLAEREATHSIPLPTNEIIASEPGNVIGQDYRAKEGAGLAAHLASRHAQAKLDVGAGRFQAGREGVAPAVLG